MTTLSLADLPGLTGAGVRVAVIDSGVHAAHPHVQGVACAIGIDEHGCLNDAGVDRLGHGTAVTAVIREKAPEAEILVARVFIGELRATAEALSAGLRWAAEARARLVNLSLGTTNPAHEAMLAEAVAEARLAGVTIVAAAPPARPPGRARAVPGGGAGALGWTRPPAAGEGAWLAEGGAQARACGFPRPAPGVPVERNLKGVSFAVANVTGLLARAWSIQQNL